MYAIITFMFANKINLLKIILLIYTVKKSAYSMRFHRIKKEVFTVLFVQKVKSECLKAPTTVSPQLQADVQLTAVANDSLLTETGI
jgi:hypothetical protein